jgi:SAM-dependent methyltransferase
MDADDGNWFESESLWARLFPYMFAEQQFAAAIENVPKIVALSGISGGALLDLACGPGRCAVPFAQAGFRVTGVDRTRFLLDKARERVGNAGVSVELVEQDMREFVRPSTFDLAINVYTIHDLFSGVGFADVRLYGSFDGTPYGPQALRLIAVARKPA